MNILRKLILAGVLALVSAPTGIYALGLGEIELSSALNQRLDARIQLLSASSRDLSEMRVQLASAAAFERAGIERSHFLTKLKFQPVAGPGGKVYIKVSSDEVVQEPFLNFIVEISWAKGQLLREYTLLLDPPTLMSARRPAVRAPVASSSMATTITPAPVSAAADDGDDNLPAPGTRVETFGPTKKNYTLWRIALRLRPDESVTVEQMMLAMLKKNPEAFNGFNVNGLKVGYILRVPDEAEMRAVEAEEALMEVRRQNAGWPQLRAQMEAGMAPPAPPMEAESAPVQPETARLKLTAPSEVPASAPKEEKSAPSGHGEGQGGAVGLVAEREKQELGSRVAELEEQIGDLRSLLKLKDAQLALMQSRLQALGEEVPVLEAAPESPASPEMTAPEEMSPEGMASSEGMPPETTASMVGGDSGMAPEAAPVAEGEQPVETADGVGAGGEPAAQTEGDDLAMLRDGAQEAAARAEAARRLGAGANAEALQPLMEVVGGDAPNEVRVAAIEALGALADAKAIPVLEKALDNPALVAAADKALDAIDAKVAAAQPARVAPMAPPPAPEPLFPGAELLEDPMILGAVAGLLILIIVGVGLAIRRRRAGGGSAPSVRPAKKEKKKAKSAPVVAADVDPLEEVTLHLEHGRYQQAEDLLRKAIEEQPQRTDLKVKLLEIYHAAKDSTSFLAFAGQVQGELSEQSNPQWLLRVREMGNELLPGEDLFAGNEAPPAPMGQGSMNETVAMEPEVEIEIPDDMDLDIDLSAFGGGDAEEVETAPEANAASMDEEIDAAVDFDLTLPGSDFSPPTPPVPDMASSPEAEVAPEAESAPEAEAEDQGNSLDFDLTLAGGDVPDMGAPVSVPAQEMPAMEFEASMPVAAASEGDASKPGEGIPGLEFEETAIGGGGADEPKAAPGSEVPGLDFDLTLPGGDAAPAASEASPAPVAAALDDEPLDLSLPGGEDAPVETDLDLSLPESGKGGDEFFDLELPSAGEESEPESEEEPALDLTLPAAEIGEDLGGDEGALDLELPVAEAEVEETPGDLDITLSGEGEVQSDTGLSLDLGVSGDEDALELDLSLPEMAEEEGAPDLTLPIGGALESLDLALPVGDEAAEDEAGEIDLSLPVAEEEPDALDLSMDADDEGDLSLDLTLPGDDEEISLELGGDESLGGLVLDLGDEVEGNALDLDIGMDEEPAPAGDGVANKLDLARAFIGMGDVDGAKALLEEVLAEGNEEQCQEAQKMMDEAG